VVAPGWRKIERPKFLHKRNKWTQSDGLIEMDGVANTTMSKHPQTLATLKFRVLQTFGHPCMSDLNPYAWIDLHCKNQLRHLCDKFCLFIFTSKFEMWYAMYIHHPCFV